MFMYRPLIIFSIIFFFNSNLLAMEKKPYHHIYKDGKLFFRNVKALNWKKNLNKNLSEKIEKKFFYEMKELGYLK